MSGQKSNKKFRRTATKIQKRMVLCSLALTAITTAAVGLAFLLPPRAPDPAKQTPEQRTAYIASKYFTRLNIDAKQAYLEQVRMLGGGFRPRQSGLNDEQRRNLRENMREVMERRMEERMNEFFNLPPEQRNQYLDQILDQRGGRGGLGGRGPGRGGRQPSAARLQRRIERTNPKTYARQMAFREALQKRAQQRGQ